MKTTSCLTRQKVLRSSRSVTIFSIYFNSMKCFTSVDNSTNRTVQRNRNHSYSTYLHSDSRVDLVKANIDKISKVSFRKFLIIDHYLTVAHEHEKTSVESCLLACFPTSSNLSNMASIVAAKNTLSFSSH